jgi:PAS domain S-box-containing protein
VVLETLRNSESRLRTLVQTIPDLIWLKDVNGVYITCNPMFERFFGAKESEIVGKSDYDFLDKDLADFFRLHDRKAIAVGGPSTNEEWITFADDGHAAYLETIKTPMYNDEGTLIGVLGIGRDITERKRIEGELQLIQSRLDSAMEAGNIAWWEMDCISGKVIFSERKAAMIGYPAEDFSVYTDFTKLVHPDDIGGIMQNMRDHIAGVSSQYDVDYRIRTKDGEYLWFHDIGRISNYSDGVPSKIIGLVIDITNRKRVEEALHESNQKLRLLTSLTRHDILNQISAIELLQDLALGATEPEKVHTYISTAQEASNQIEKIIGFTREYESFGIASSGWQQVYQMIESAREEVSLGGVTIENHVLQGLGIYADPIIRKVFTTLMENAIRHGEKVAQIHFSCGERDGAMIITCSDDGVGIPFEEKESIFSHGYGKHTGIGLFLSREILSITGLSIRECGVPLLGARFEIIVPAGKYRYDSVPL